MSWAHYSLQERIQMRERKPLRWQVDSLSFTLTENGRALYRSDITCVRSKIIFSPEFNVAISVGMHRSGT